MAALSSSLLSVGDATVSSPAAEDGSQAAGLEMLTMEANGLQIVTTKINRAGGHMVLMAGARPAGRGAGGCEGHRRRPDQAAGG